MPDSPSRWLRPVFRFAAGSLVALLAGLVLVVAGALLMLRWQARGGLPADAGRVTRAEVPATALAQRARASRSPLAPGAKQILFGDLHVHTQFSSDARVFGLPLFEGEGAHPPADACDFARFCSALDFWSINDHAEQMLPEQWRETRASIRACNEAAGDPADPETVAFLGWEWSQTGLSASTHYGHRNVVLRDTDDEATPTRPIAAGRWNAWAWIGALHAQADPRPEADYRSYRRYLWEGLTADRCPDGVPVRELPADCLEVAETPDRLFEKLDAWGMPSLVIPHGLSWGTTNPPGATLDHQLGAMHDPSRQRLLEVYSGHGSSELWRDLRHFEMDAAGEPTCPAPGADFTPCCWRAGQIVRERCDEPRSDRCEREVEAARAAAFGRFLYGDIGTTLEGASPEDWLDCGQLRGAFLPAFGYRPQQSAQYALALTGEDEGDRFRFGLIGSSDNHRARPGTGYKEFGLGAMTDGNRPVPGWARDESGWRARLIRTLSAPGRNDAFYYTGGLVAVHAPDRSRESIFAALERREVYGTSGPRIQLWFDLLGASGARHPMGSELRGAGPLRFEVRAAGAHVERPGCPSHVETRLGPERLASLCLGECHFPGDTRHPIDRIEIVRIRPGRALPEAIQDPWRSFPCRGEGEGCRVAFEDPDPPAGEVLYYARALQAPTEAVGGDPLSCERDEAGRCVRAELCVSAGYDQPVPEACRAPVQERAWSSPIFVSVDAGGS